VNATRVVGLFLPLSKENQKSLRLDTIDLNPQHRDIGISAFFVEALFINGLTYAIIGILWIIQSYDPWIDLLLNQNHSLV